MTRGRVLWAALLGILLLTPGHFKVSWATPDAPLSVYLT